ncbi:MAG: nitroreductase family deazaflavin-dependent oxidoreductase [Chloroflexota bacterium]
MRLSSSHIRPPRGFSRTMWRLPIWLYRLHLGWLLTGHFLMLEHIGRKSGSARQAVIEVIKHDRAKDVYYVAAGFGPASDWYQNLLKTPQARIHSGFRREEVEAAVLSIEEAENILMDYAHRYPAAIRTLAGIIGYEVKKGDEDYRALVRFVPIVALKVCKE